MTVIYRRWIRGVKRKLLRFHRRSDAPVSNIKPNEDKEIIQSLRQGKVQDEGEESKSPEEMRESREMTPASQQQEDVILSKEEIAAIKIQACLRGHLARRAFRALRGLVRLQAVVRGYCMRRQARIALRCMNSIARLQVRVQNRQQMHEISAPAFPPP